MRHAVDILVDRAFRRIEIGLFDSGLKFVLGWLHEWRMERSADL